MFRPCRTSPAGFGVWLRRQEVSDFIAWPPDGGTILHPAHFAERFEVDAERRNKKLDAPICAIGPDLTSDLSRYDQRLLNSVFYVLPSNVAKQSMMPYNYAVTFDAPPISNEPVLLETEINDVVESGNFSNMCHLLDRSTVTQGGIGFKHVHAL